MIVLADHRPVHKGIIPAAALAPVTLPAEQPAVGVVEDAVVSGGVVHPPEEQFVCSVSIQVQIGVLRLSGPEDKGQPAVQGPGLDRPLVKEGKTPRQQLFISGPGRILGGPRRTLPPAKGGSPGDLQAFPASGGIGPVLGAAADEPVLPRRDRLKGPSKGAAPALLQPGGALARPAPVLGFQRHLDPQAGGVPGHLVMEVGSLGQNKGILVNSGLPGLQGKPQNRLLLLPLDLRPNLFRKLQIRHILLLQVSNYGWADRAFTSAAVRGRHAAESKIALEIRIVQIIPFAGGIIGTVAIDIRDKVLAVVYRQA